MAVRGVLERDGAVGRIAVRMAGWERAGRTLVCVGGEEWARARRRRRRCAWHRVLSRVVLSHRVVVRRAGGRQSPTSCGRGVGGRAHHDTHLPPAPPPSPLAQEDKRLVTLVEKHGTHNWPDVATEMGPNRTSKSCSLRCVAGCCYQQEEGSGAGGNWGAAVGGCAPRSGALLLLLLLPASQVALLFEPQPEASLRRPTV